MVISIHFDCQGYKECLKGMYFSYCKVIKLHGGFEKVYIFCDWALFGEVYFLFRVTMDVKFSA